MLAQYNIRSMFKNPLQNFGRHQRGDPIHLLRSTASTTTCQIVRRKEDAFEKQIAGKWHVITLQEASEYADHDILTNRFHVTHHGGCAILCNKDAFHPNIDVKSIYLHDTRRDLPDQVMEGAQVWVMQGVLSGASFRRPPLSGQKTFTVLPPHISHIYAKKRGIAKKLILTIRAIMIGHHIDLVAGDLNGTAWRCSNRDNMSTIDEAFADSALPTPPGPTPLWRPRSMPTTVLTSVDSSNRPIQIGIGRYACMVLSPSRTKLSACVQPIEAAIMRHGSTWISSIGAIPNHITKNLTDEFYSKSVLHHIITGRRKGASAISWATIRSLRDRATIHTCASTLCENLYILTKWPDDVSHSVTDMFWFRPLFSCFILVCFDIHFAQPPSRTPRHGVKKRR